MIEEKADDKKIFYVHGGVETEEREKIRFITEKSDNAIIVASFGTFSTALILVIFITLFLLVLVNLG